VIKSEQADSLEEELSATEVILYTPIQHLFLDHNLLVEEICVRFLESFHEVKEHFG
jgi:hypothetical protein